MKICISVPIIIIDSKKCARKFGGLGVFEYLCGNVYTLWTVIITHYLLYMRKTLLMIQIASVAVLAACTKTQGGSTSSESTAPETAYELAPIEAYVRNPSAFHDGRAAVQVGDRFGYINRAGQLVIPCTLVMANDFSEGYALVHDYSSDLCSYIDTLGNVVSPFEFENGWVVSDGMARVTMPGQVKGCRYIELATGRVMECEYDAAYDFHDGMAKVGLGADYQTRKYGYIDKQGALKVDCQYDWADDFSEGLAAVGNGNYSTVRYGFIDREGRQVIAPQFTNARAFTEGKAFVRMPDMDYSVACRCIDREGNMLFAGFRDGQPYQGKAAVMIDSEGKYCLADDRGQRISAKYEVIYSRVEEGRVLASDGKQWHVLDMTGKVVSGSICEVSPVNDPVLSECGLVLLKEGTIWVYRDMQGRMVLPLNPEDAPEPERLAEVEIEGPDKAMGEVWPHLGGMYPFMGLDDCTISVIIEDESSVLLVGEDSYRAEVDEQTGRILAFDQEGRRIFCGYLYAGGCKLAGNLGGKRIECQLLGGL